MLLIVLFQMMEELQLLLTVEITADLTYEYGSYLEDYIIKFSKIDS